MLFRSDYDFAISMWVKIPLSQSYTTNSSNFIIGKNGNDLATINQNLGGDDNFDDNKPIDEYDEPMPIGLL